MGSQEHGEFNHLLSVIIFIENRDSVSKVMNHVLWCWYSAALDVTLADGTKLEVEGGL
jgi:hypothetical protein